jgi:hypothetical protein
VAVKKPATVGRAELVTLASGITRDLEAMRRRIDALGDLATQVSGTTRCDMLGCFASNTLYGTQALVEQLMFVAAHPRAKRARWP